MIVNIINFSKQIENRYHIFFGTFDGITFQRSKILFSSFISLPFLPCIDAMRRRVLAKKFEKHTNKGIGSKYWQRSALCMQRWVNVRAIN